MVSEWVELNNGMRILKVRIPDSRPPEVRKMLGYANTLRGLLKSDFLRYLKDWALSADDIENLLCVMQRYPRYAINGQQMKWLEEYKESLSVKLDDPNEFKDKYAEYVPNVDAFIKKLKTIKGKELKHKYDEWFAKSDISFKDFFADCQKIVPERNNEKGWNYDAIRKH